jgi:O-antigen biosynthesis protein WbqP
MEAHGLTHKQPLERVVSEPRWLSTLRRLFDIAFAAGLILILSPLLIAVAIAVRLDSHGPALFRQRRVGFRQREFTLFKFRSMRLDADPRGHQEYVTALINGKDEDAGNLPEGGKKDLYKLAVDNRITPVGRWIRKWSLDELPQLFNVVLGDMTLVGPRPALFNQDDLVALRTEAGVHRLRPGVTGWAQVNGRDELPIPVKVAFDREYLERRSFGFDLKILFLTVAHVLTRKGVSH